MTGVRSPIPSLDNVSEADKQWLTGFIEGDGSIVTSNVQPRINVYQKDTRVLQFIQDLVRGGVLAETGPGCGVLKFYGYDRCLPIVILLGSSIVGQRAISRVARTFELKLDTHKPTMPWTVGFWDAEGHFGYGASKFTAGVTQKDQELLMSIRELVGGRMVNVHNAFALHLARREAREFIPYYLRYSRNPAKRERLTGLLYYLASQSPLWANYYARLKTLELL